MKRYLRGFTLIELLVVIGLISAISIYLLPSIGNIRDDQLLINTAAELQSRIKVAQSNAVSGVSCGPTASSYTYPASNWYIYLSQTPTPPTNYYIKPTCTDPSHSTTPQNSYTLPASLFINSFTGGGCNYLPNTTWTLPIYFNNITGMLNIPNCPSFSTTSSFYLQLKSSSTGSTRTVVIEKGGRVYVTNP